MEWYVRLVLGCVLFCAPLLSHAEYIESFDSQIEIHKDSSFDVIETIEYVFTEEKHGIFRYIPLIHPEVSEHFLKERIIEVSMKSVKVDGGDVPYTEEGERDQFYLKIGDPNETITGRHTYTIKYNVNGGLSYPKGQGTEFYFNVTGNGWGVPMKTVSARIFSPDSLFLQNRSCYRDLGGSSASCDQTKQEDGSIVFRTTELMGGEGITIAQALNTTNVERIIIERFKILWVMIPLVIIFIGAATVFLYRFKTKYRTGRTIIAQYEPYSGMKPMYTGVIMDGRLDPRDITACIVFLAERGYLKIRKVEKKVLFFFEVDDYEITLLKEIDDTVSHFERSILTLLLSEPLVPDTTVTLSELKSDLTHLRTNQKILVELKKSLNVDLLDNKFFESSLASLGIRRRTIRGYEAFDHLKGFKLFLEMTEKDRYAFHNAPKKSPEQFMEYLPYAIAFGVEKQWAIAFEGITIPNPGWYDGGSAGSFSAANLTTSLGGFSTAFAASSGASASSGGGSSGGGSGGGGGGSW